MTYLYVGSAKPVTHLYVGSAQPMTHLYVGSAQPVTHLYVGSAQPVTHLYVESAQPVTHLYVGEGVDAEVVDLASLPVRLSVAVVQLLLGEARASIYPQTRELPHQPHLARTQRESDASNAAKPQHRISRFHVQIKSNFLNCNQIKKRN